MERINRGEGPATMLFENNYQFLSNSVWVFAERLEPIQPVLELVLTIGSLIAMLITVLAWCRRILRKITFPYRMYRETLNNYSKEYCDTLSKYYISTRAQEIDPCNQEEIRNNNGKFNSFPLIPFFKKEAFKKSSTGRFYLVLADSGMGKTTFLLQLYKKCIPYVFAHKYEKIVLVSLADVDCINKIQQIGDGERTILLLDGLDENNEAIEDCDHFFSKLVAASAHFNKVVITCRTQFYASAQDEPFRTGVIHVGRGNKSCEIVKKYISPFNDEEVRQYLRKRFSFRRKIQKKAFEIVNVVPNLMVRPIVLNWIEFLCDEGREYQYSFQIYETIIQKWIEREELGDGSNKLYELSADVANYMYAMESTTIPAERVDKIASKNRINLKPIIAKSRSLLNRNSDGVYKFAHRSFLEYFIVDNIFKNMKLPGNTNFLWSLSGARLFLFERLISVAKETDEDQINRANKQIKDNYRYSTAESLLDFLQNPKIKLNAKSNNNILTIEAWLYYLPADGYDGKETFNIDQFFSATEGPIHQSINREGTDVGAIFTVTKDVDTTRVCLSVEVRNKRVAFTMGAFS